jgi:hypothetical protein
MQGAADIADPLVDVRDVVETFRQCGMTLADWHETLQTAVAALDDLRGAAQADVWLLKLSAQLRVLLERGLEDQPLIVDDVATWVARILAETKVPGIPKPDEEDWGFRAS